MIRLLLAALCVPAFAALRPTPSADEFRAYFGWYATQPGVTPGMVALVGVAGIGELVNTVPDGRPWILIDGWPNQTPAPVSPRLLSANLITRFGATRFDRVPGLRKARLNLGGLPLMRLPRTYEGTLNFNRLLKMNEAGAQAAQDRVRAMTAYLLDGTNAGRVSVEIIARAREMAITAERRHQAHWRLEKRFGYSDANTIYFRLRGMIPRESWADVRVFEESAIPWRPSERPNQLHLMNAITLHSTNMRASAEVRAAAEVGIPGFTYEQATKQLLTLLCQTALGGGEIGLAPGDLEHNGHVQMKSLAR